VQAAEHVWTDRLVYCGNRERSASAIGYADCGRACRATKMDSMAAQADVRYVHIGNQLVHIDMVPCRDVNLVSGNRHVGSKVRRGDIRPRRFPEAPLPFR